MKKLLFVAVLAIAAIAQTYEEINDDHDDRSGHSVIMGKIGCEREVWLKDAIRFHEERNEAAMKRYLKSGRCYALRDPSMVIVRQKLTDDLYWVQAVINGKKLWIEVDGVTSEPSEPSE